MQRHCSGTAAASVMVVLAAFWKLYSTYYRAAVFNLRGGVGVKRARVQGVSSVEGALRFTVDFARYVQYIEYSTLHHFLPCMMRLLILRRLLLSIVMIGHWAFT